MSNLKFYLMKDDEPVGPYTSDEITRLYRDKILSSETPVASEGATEWRTAEHWVSQFSATASEPKSDLTPGKRFSSTAETKPEKIPQGCAGCAVLVASILLLAGLFALFDAFAGFSTREISGFEIKRRSDYVPDRGMPFLKREAVWSNQPASSEDRTMTGFVGLILVGIGVFIFGFMHKESQKALQKTKGENQTGEI